MLNEDRTGSNGNIISVPDDHDQDDRAPDTLKKALASLDLRGPALSLQRELADEWKGNKEGFMAGAAATLLRLVEGNKETPHGECRGGGGLLLC